MNSRKFSLIAKGVGPQYSDNSNNPLCRVHAYSNLDTSIGYSFAVAGAGAFELDFNINNLLGTRSKNYRILGACNPALAHKALQIEDKVGTMLPCNVVVQETGDGKTEVAVIDPVASMQAIDNARLKAAAEEVRGKLRKVVEML